MDNRKLAILRLRYLWPLRNGPSEYRRQCRYILRRLRWPKMTRSERIARRVCAERVRCAMSLWGMVDRLCGGHSSF
jgi:hypothetical protein